MRRASTCSSVKRLVGEVDRPRRNSGSDELLDPFGRRAAREYLLEQRDELGAIRVALRVRRETRVDHERGLDAEDLAELRPQPLVADGDDHRLVARAHGLIRRDVRMRVAEPRGALAGREIARADVREPAQLRVDERHVDELPGVAAGRAVVARIQRREHAHAGVDAARDIGHRRRKPAGPAVDGPRQRHQARFALRDDVVTAAVRLRPRVAVAADRARRRAADAARAASSGSRLERASDSSRGLFVRNTSARPISVCKTRKSSAFLVSSSMLRLLRLIARKYALSPSRNGGPQPRA